jgi:hypothetical protein
LSFFHPFKKKFYNELDGNIDKYFDYCGFAVCEGGFWQITDFCKDSGYFPIQYLESIVFIG